VGFEVGHEFAGVGAVDDAVVEAEGEVLHGADARVSGYLRDPWGGMTDSV